MTYKDNSTFPNGFHLGNRIKEVLAADGRTITWLAHELGCTRDNLYKIFNHTFLNTDLLFKICVVTNHDFFKECSEQLKIKKKNRDMVL